MSATFDPALPTALDRIRFALGDTDVSDPEAALVPDETINAAITEWGETEATARLAQGLATKYAQDPSSIAIGGDIQVAFRRVETWQALADRMHSLAVTGGSGGATGGVTRVRRRDEVDRSEYRRDLTYWS